MLSSLLAWLDIRSLGGQMLFRLEDLDPERSWDEYARLMAEDLRWLGLDWDLGWPEEPGCRQGLRTAATKQPLKGSRHSGSSTPAGARARSALRPARRSRAEEQAHGLQVPLLLRG